MTFNITKDSVEYWHSVAESLSAEARSNAEECAVWAKLARIQDRTICKLILTCCGLGVVVLALGVTLWLTW